MCVTVRGCGMLPINRQESAKDGTVTALKSKFQIFNAKVSQTVDLRQMDGQTDRQHQPELLCNSAEKH